jgi:dynein heavy chain 1
VDVLAVAAAAAMADGHATSLQRCLAREALAGAAALAAVRADVAAARAYRDGTARPSAALRRLLGSVAAGVVPDSWRALHAGADTATTVAAWAADLRARADALASYLPLLTATGPAADAAGQQAVFWVGGMFAPDAFITATRQRAAQARQWSLEELEACLDVGCADAGSGGTGAVVRGLVLEGARWAAGTGTGGGGSGGGGGGGLALCDALRTPLPPSRLRWQRRADRPPGVHYVAVPAYLSAARAVLVTEVLMVAPPPTDVPAHVWAQRGVGIVLQEPVL